jgi:hypothetical protein
VPSSDRMGVPAASRPLETAQRKGTLEHRLNRPARPLTPAPVLSNTPHRPRVTLTFPSQSSSLGCVVYGASSTSRQQRVFPQIECTGNAPGQRRIPGASGQFAPAEPRSRRSGLCVWARVRSAPKAHSRRRRSAPGSRARGPKLAPKRCDQCYLLALLPQNDKRRTARAAVPSVTGRGRLTCRKDLQDLAVACPFPRSGVPSKG